jgi:hypothetical protein
MKTNVFLAIKVAICQQTTRVYVQTDTLISMMIFIKKIIIKKIIIKKKGINRMTVNVIQ